MKRVIALPLPALTVRPFPPGERSGPELFPSKTRQTAANGPIREGESEWFVALRRFGRAAWQSTSRYARQIVPNLGPGRDKRDTLIPDST